MVISQRLQSNFSALLLGLIAIVTLQSCSPAFRQKTLSPDKVTLRELKEGVDRNYLGLETLRGNARMQVQMENMAYEANTEVKIQMPDSLHLKLEVMLGIDIGLFFGNRERFKLYSPQENILYSGSLDSVDLAKFFQIDLTYDDLLEAFTGTPKIIPGKTKPVTIDDGKYKLITLTEEGLHRYWIDPEKFVVTRYQFFNRKGSLRMEKEFKRFKKYDDIYLPRIIQIKKPHLKQYFNLFYTNHNVNKKVLTREFEISTPQNCKWIKL